MPIHVSPGVYVTITDLSKYTQLVPSTQALFIFLSDKGEDNVLRYFSDEEELINNFGKPNVNKYGPYGQGYLVADAFFEAGGGGYCMRVLPEDASYGNMYQYIDPINNLVLDGYQSDLNSESEIDVFLEGDYNHVPIVMFYGAGRGSYYNELSVKLTPVVNKPGVYVCDIYGTTQYGTQIIRSYYVSFDESLLDDSGESYYIEHVINRYCDIVKVKVNKDNIAALNNIVTYNAIDQINTPPSAPNNGDVYVVGPAPTDAFIGHANEIATYDSGTASWTFTTPARGSVAKLSSPDKKIYYTGLVWVDYDPFACIFSPVSTDDTSYKQFQYGSEGSLVNSDGTINQSVATKLLVDAFTGVIDVNVVNTTNIWFGLVFDGAYPDPVKNAIVELASDIRRDCVALVDNGDNPTPEEELKARQNAHNWNTKYAALYCNYTYVYDKWTGRYIWVTPLYHLAKVIAKEQAPWFAPAGEGNASLEGIEQARYNLPTINWRDQFALNQLNPIMKFSFGYTIWGDLTTQRYASKLQNLPCMRLTLYASHAISQFCDSYIFQNNDEVEWDQIRSQVSLFLSELKRRRALSKYDVEVGANEYELKTKQCHVNIVLYPITPLEQINLNFFIK